MKNQLDAKATKFIPNFIDDNRILNEDVAEDDDETDGIDETYMESFERASADLEMLRAAYPDEITLGCGYGHELNKDKDADKSQHEADDEQQPNWFPLIFTLDLRNQDKENKFGATITMEFPKGYPMSKSLEVVSYRSSPSTKKEIIEEVVKAVKNEALEAINTYGGVECGFSCCAAAIECWTTLIESEQQLLHDRKEKTNKENCKANKYDIDDDIHWITSENTLVSKKSAFQAHLCIVKSENMVSRAVNKLIEGSTKIQRATHNMVCSCW